MGAISRAKIYVKKNTRRNLIVCSIFILFMSVLLLMQLIGLQVSQATEELKQSIGAELTLNGKQLSTGISGEIIEKIADVSGVDTVLNRRSYGGGIISQSSGQQKKLITKKNIGLTDKDNESNVKIISTDNLILDETFSGAKFKSVEGVPHGEKDATGIAIHQDLAKRNDLKVGDIIKLKAERMSYRTTISHQITSIFQSTKEQGSTGLIPSNELYENMVFISNDLGTKIFFGEGSDKSQYVDFKLNDPENIPKIIKEIKKIGGLNWEKVVFSKNNSVYYNMKQALNTIVSVTNKATVAVIIIGISLLSILLAFWYKQRRREIGILIAIGIEKSSILLQLITEIGIQLLVAFPFVITVYFALGPLASKVMRSSVEDSEILGTMSNTLSITSIVITFCSMILISLISIFIASRKLLRISPKSILSNYE